MRSAESSSSATPRDRRPLEPVEQSRRRRLLRAVFPLPRSIRAQQPPTIASVRTTRNRCAPAYRGILFDLFPLCLCVFVVLNVCMAVTSVFHLNKVSFAYSATPVLENISVDF